MEYVQQQLNFKLDCFEGPLDLMLFLISKHKLDINDIEITSLLNQYMSYIEEMKNQDLEVASEFLEMAARLVYIKTAALLPKYEDESEKLKRELEGQLLEYQLLKAVAGIMREEYHGDDMLVREQMNIKVDMTYKRQHNVDELVTAYVIVAGKAKKKLPPPRSAFSPLMERHIVSVESRIVYILKRLYKDEKVSYNEFFGGERSEMVGTFLAMLELIKSSRIKVSDDNSYVYFNKDNKSDEPLKVTIDESNNEDS